MYEVDVNKLTHGMLNNPRKWFVLREGDELHSNVSLDSSDIHYRVLNRYGDTVHEANIVNFYLHERLNLLKLEPEHFYMQLITIPISGTGYSELYAVKFNRAKKILKFYKTERELKIRRAAVEKEIVPEPLSKPESSSDHRLMEKITSYLRRVINREFEAQEKPPIIETHISPHGEEKVKINKYILFNLSDSPHVDWSSVFGNPSFAVNGSRSIINNVGLDSTIHNYFLKALRFVEEDISSLEKIRDNLIACF